MAVAEKMCIPVDAFSYIHTTLIYVYIYACNSNLLIITEEFYTGTLLYIEPRIIHVHLFVFGACFGLGHVCFAIFQLIEQSVILVPYMFGSP